MEDKSRERQPPKTPAPSPEQERELEAKKKLARPPKDNKEVTIAPTAPSGPDVLIS